jgi:hypothetical protein
LLRCYGFGYAPGGGEKQVQSSEFKVQSSGFEVRGRRDETKGRGTTDFTDFTDGADWAAKRRKRRKKGRGNGEKALNAEAQRTQRYAEKDGRTTDRADTKDRQNTPDIRKKAKASSTTDND